MSGVHEFQAHVTYEHLSKTTYRSQVVQETARICSPITRSARICTAPVTIKSIPFEEGTMVTVPIYEVNHSPDVRTPIP
ncbi:cytochrome P450 [Aphelenchoides avenae]|nr:cytochrome P450 [Aphelenchus avenae]